MALCAAGLTAAIMVSCLACAKTDVEAHEIIWNCELVYSIDRKKAHQPYYCGKILFGITTEMSTSGGTVFEVSMGLAALQ